MIYFILGFFAGSFILFAAQLLSKDVSRVVERYQKTGSVLAKNPIIVPGYDETKEFIKETFDV